MSFKYRLVVLTICCLITVSHEVAGLHLKYLFFWYWHLLVMHIFVCVLMYPNGWVGRLLKLTASNFASKRLFDDLITGYNRLIRPVGNNTEKLTVNMGLKLTQILEVVRFIDNTINHLAV